MKSLLKRMGRKKNKRGSQDGRGSVSESVGEDQMSENASVHSSAASSYRSERARTMTQDEEFLSFDSEPSIKAAPPTIATNKSVSPRSMQEHPLHLDTSLTAAGSAGLTPMAQILPRANTESENNKVEVAEGWLLPQTPAAPPQVVSNSDLLSLDLSMSSPGLSGGEEAGNPIQPPIASNLGKTENDSIQNSILSNFGDWPSPSTSGPLLPPTASSLPSEPQEARVVAELQPRLLNVDSHQSSDLAVEPPVDATLNLKQGGTDSSAGTFEPIINVLNNTAENEQAVHASDHIGKNEVVIDNIENVKEAPRVEGGQLIQHDSNDESVVAKINEAQSESGVVSVTESVDAENGSIMTQVQAEPAKREQEEVIEGDWPQQLVAVDSGAHGEDLTKAGSEPDGQQEELSMQWPRQEKAFVEEVIQPAVPSAQVKDDEEELSEDWPQTKEVIADSPYVRVPHEGIAVKGLDESRKETDVESDANPNVKRESISIETHSVPITDGEGFMEGDIHVFDMQVTQPSNVAYESVEEEPELSGDWPQQVSVEPAAEPPQPEKLGLIQVQDADELHEVLPEQVRVEPIAETPQPEESTMPVPGLLKGKEKDELSAGLPPQEQSAVLESKGEMLPPVLPDVQTMEEETELHEDWPKEQPTVIEPTVQDQQPSITIKSEIQPELAKDDEDVDLSEDWPQEMQIAAAIQSPTAQKHLSEEPTKPEARSEVVIDEEELNDDWPQQEETADGIDSSKTEPPVVPPKIEEDDGNEYWSQQEQAIVEPVADVQQETGVTQEKEPSIVSQGKQNDDEDLDDDWPQPVPQEEEVTVEPQTFSTGLGAIGTLDTKSPFQDDMANKNESSPTSGEAKPDKSAVVNDAGLAESTREAITDYEQQSEASRLIEAESNQVASPQKPNMFQAEEEEKPMQTASNDYVYSPSAVRESTPPVMVGDEPIAEDTQQTVTEDGVKQQIEPIAMHQQQPIHTTSEAEKVSFGVEEQEPSQQHRFEHKEEHDVRPWAASFEDEQYDIEQQSPERTSRVESEDSFHDVAWSPTTGDKSVPSSSSARKLPASPIPHLGGNKKNTAVVGPSSNDDVEESKIERAESAEERSPSMQERTTLLGGNEKKQQSKAGAIASKLFKNVPGSKRQQRKSGQVIDEELGLGAEEEDDVEDEDVTSSPTPLQVISGDENTTSSWFRRVCYPKRPVLVCIVLFILSLIISSGVGKSSISSVSDNENPIKQAADENVRRLQMALGDTKPVIISTVGSNRDGLRAVQTVLSSLGMQIPDNVPYNGLTLRTKDDIVFKAKFKRVLTNSLNPDDGLMFEERSAAVTGSLVEWHLGRAFVAGLINATFEAIPPELRTGKHWGIAHPRAGYLLPYFKSVLGGPENFIFMHVVRNGVLVASSAYEEFRHLCRLVKLDSYCENQAENKLNFWADMNAGAYHWAKRTLDVDHYIVVRAEDFITGNKECIMRVAKILGMNPTDEVLDAAIEAGKKARDQIAGFDNQGPSDVEDVLQTLPDVQKQMEFWGYKDSTKMMECKSQEWF